MFDSREPAPESDVHLTVLDRLTARRRPAFRDTFAAVLRALRAWLATASTQLGQLAASARAARPRLQGVLERWPSLANAVRAAGRRVVAAGGGEGPLPVHDAHPSTAGPVILRALERQARVADLLATEGEPDTLEVRGKRLEAKRIILVYRRPVRGQPRRIVLDPSGDGYIARSPEPLRRRRAPVRAAQVQAPTTRPPCADCPKPQPSAVQTLECPIDPARDDCRAFCTGGSSYEWCR